MFGRRRLAITFTLGCLAGFAPTVACASTPAASGGMSATPTVQIGGHGSVPRPDHVVVVVFENKREDSIIGNPDAPYFNQLATGGALMAQSFAITHPSQPNYLALFSGSTHGVADDNCGYSFKANNQAHEMLKAGFTFTSYAEGLPQAGSLVCTAGEYARKHAPWTNFPNVPASAQQPYTSFPSDYAQLPDVSWVIPNLCDDMHDCSIATGDTWLKANLGAYADWAETHNSLLIVTFDEDDTTGDNQIPTIFYGQDVKPGSYNEHITHYNVLRTMEDMYGVPRLLNAKKAKPITDIWRK
jgi:hypothetical protein